MPKGRGHLSVYSLNLVKKNKFRYDISKLKVKSIKKQEIINKIKKAGYKASETHFSGNGIRSDIPEKELIKLFSKT